MCLKKHFWHLSAILFVIIFAISTGAKAQSVAPVVFNAGVGGNNTVDLLRRIDKDCLGKNPDLTVLMIGTNDMNSVKYIPLEQYKRNLSKIIDSILHAHSKVLLMNVLPMYPPYLFTRHPKAFYGEEGPEGRLAEMNAAIWKIAQEKAVTFLDIHHVFEKIGDVGLDRSSYIRNEVNSHMTDGIHPTPDGYRAIAIAVYECIKSNRLPHERVVCFGDSITKGDGTIDRNSYPAYLKRLLQN